MRTLGPRSTNSGTVEIMKPYVLLTRPKGVTDFWKETLHQAHIPTLAAPLLEIHPQEIEWPAFTDYEGVIVTSARAAEVLADHDTSPCLFCVGQATSDRAKELGFETVVASSGTAEALIADLSQYEGKKFLYLAGTVTSTDLPGILQEKGVSVDTLVVYDAVPVSTFSAEVLNALKKKRVMIVPFWSLAAAQAFLALRKDGISFTHMTAVCKSKRIEAAVSATGWRRVITDPSMDPNSIAGLYKELTAPALDYKPIAIGAGAFLIAAVAIGSYYSARPAPVIEAPAPILTPIVPAPPSQPDPSIHKLKMLEETVAQQAAAIAQVRQQQQVISETQQKLETLIQEIATKQAQPPQVITAPSSNKLLIATNLLYLEQSLHPDVVWKLIRDPLLKNSATQDLVLEFDKIITTKISTRRELLEDLSHLTVSEPAKETAPAEGEKWVDWGKKLITKHIQVKRQQAPQTPASVKESVKLLSTGDLKGAVAAIPDELRKSEAGIAWLARAHQRLRFEEIIAGLTDLVLTASDTPPAPEVTP